MEEPVLAIQPLPQDKAALLRYLEKTNPESLALARDWDDIALAIVRTKERLAVYEQFSLSLSISRLQTSL